MPKIEIAFETFATVDDLPLADKALVDMAKEATRTAYAPYSNFWVGVAVLLSNGTITKGSNQENAAYPSGLCAERVAFFNIGVMFPTETIVAVAVVARGANEVQFTPVTPCGACRQVMVEYEQKQHVPIRIIFQDLDKQYYILPNITSLLPFQFSALNLK